MEGLTRDRDYINKHITKRNGKYYSDVKCAIEYPAWYNDKGMGSMTDEVLFYGIFIIIIDDKYSVSLVPTICKSNPIVIKEVMRNGEKYIRLEFGRDDPIVNVSVIKETLLSYNYFNNFFIRMNVPWFLNYEDRCKLQGNTVKYAGSNIGINPMINELIVSYVTRSKDNPDIFFRQTDLKGDYGYVDLMNSFYSIKTTTGKLTGSYLQDGIVSALIKKNTGDVTDMERHLKG